MADVPPRLLARSSRPLLRPSHHSNRRLAPPLRSPFGLAAAHSLLAAAAQVVTNTFKKPVTNLMFYGSLVSLAIALGLLAITSTLGRAFERLTASGELIGMVRPWGRDGGRGGALPWSHPGPCAPPQDNEQGEEEKQPLKHAAAEDEESPKA